MAIHNTAIIDKTAVLANDVEIGAYSIIGANVKIAKGSKIAEHCVINGHTTIGCNNTIYPFCSIGSTPQDKKYKEEQTSLIIGDNNTFFHGMTVSLGTEQDLGVTKIGNDNWFMAYVHIAHDCQIGSHTVFANAATLGGHVTVGDYAILGGLTAVHQFCIIGDYVMAGGGSIIVQDVPPYVITQGNHASPSGVNSEGLRRHGFDSESINMIKRAYKTLYRQGLSYENAKEEITKQIAGHDELLPFIRFFAKSKRGIIR